MAFPINDQSPIEHNAELPSEADAVVIGGGIIGVMTAWELAKAGLKPVLLEKGRVAGEQSSRNWGWVRAQGRDLAEIPIMLEAQAMWREIDKRVGGVGLTQSGTLYLGRDDQAVEGFQGWLDQVAPHNLSSRILSAHELMDQLPQANARWAGALYTPTDFRAEPWRAVPKFASAAVADGVTIIENCAVRALDLVGGAVSGVITERGRIASKRVALAGGSWSSLLLRRHGVSIPQLSVRATVAASGALPEITSNNAVDDRLAWRRRADGGYTLAPSGFHELFVGPDAFRAFARFMPQLLQDPLGTRYLPAAPRGFPDAWGTGRRWAEDSVSPFEKMRILNPAPNRAKVRKLARDFADTFPSLGPVHIKEAWAGMIDVMPDVVPIVDTCDALPNLTICTGMCGHGFGIGPAFGRITAKLMQGHDAGHDLSRFRLGRFSDRSTLVLGPNL
ncbi:NAD(P)/FAD-dependent oxidoreductase [Planktotalea sp.]|uniref:NAD(P)/FAD-dependent oxidoreductase n=1 Tax=Planktotalea sp. TaxID=2029877 RepID=UPI003D6A245E